MENTQFVLDAGLDWQLVQLTDRPGNMFAFFGGGDNLFTKMRTLHVRINCLLYTHKYDVHNDKTIKNINHTVSNEPA